MNDGEKEKKVNVETNIILLSLVDDRTTNQFKVFCKRLRPTRKGYQYNKLPTKL